MVKKQVNTLPLKQQFKTQLTNLEPTVVPTCSAWFSPSKIHQLEKESLPEFFTGKKLTKTPESYKKMRNIIVDMYRENTRAYLTATTCRRRLAGDACTILRVHAFLEHWGLINFNYDPKKRDFTRVSSSYKETGGDIESKLDLLVKARESIDPQCNDDPYFHTFASLTRRIRPRCDSCSHFCADRWYRRDLPTVDDGHPEMPYQF
jgi:SWI/SNF related-matrix-associated actin-dependent regulator of chromatin subfamily C